MTAQRAAEADAGLEIAGGQPVHGVYDLVDRLHEQPPEQIGEHGPQHDADDGHHQDEGVFPARIEPHQIQRPRAQQHRERDPADDYDRQQYPEYHAAEQQRQRRALVAIVSLQAFFTAL